MRARDADPDRSGLSDTSPVELPQVTQTRAEELGKLAVRLVECDAGALILITGPSGSGKSCYLRQACADAARCGWPTAPRGPTGELYVTQSTTPAAFTQWVAETVRELADEIGSPPASPCGLGGGSIFELIGEIARLPRLLLVIDGYHPSAAFAEWFTEEWLPLMRSVPCKVVLVVSESTAGEGGEETAEAASLRERADSEIRLGNLSDRPVRDFFEALALRISPHMTTEEVNCYVRAAAENPSTLQSLGRLLALAAPTEK